MKKFVGDGYCDTHLNIPECDFDDGDCDFESFAHCHNRYWIGDNECDIFNNITECDFDGGDCLGLTLSEGKINFSISFLFYYEPDFSYM